MNRGCGTLNGVRLALRAIRRNKLRAGLTVLGILIGVTAVIAITTLGAGARESNRRQIEGLGSNLIMVFSASDSKSLSQTAGHAGKRLTEEDERAIVREVPGVAAAAPFLGAPARVVYGDRSASTTVSGTTTSFLGIRSWTIARGAMWTERDEMMKSRVCVLGSSVARTLFEGEDPIGQTVRIGRFPHRVVGVLGAKGASPLGRDQDDVVFMPIGSVRARLMKSPPGFAGMLFVSATSSQVVERVVKQIDGVLRERHGLGEELKPDFEIATQKDFQSKIDQMSAAVTLLLVISAGVSLFVGGIGVMNIMLVSVAERTREIGLRRALGASSRDIRTQFLCEAVVLALVGGAIGVLFGTGIAAAAMRALGWQLHLNGGAIAVSLICSAATGIAFGLFPASRAARLDPIVALRRE